MRIAICDDDSVQIEYLTREVSAWASLEEKNVRIDAFFSSEAFLFEYSENKDYDVLLLDIEMPGMNGMDLAWKLRSEGSLLHIVFITGYADYISEGYDVSALHYLMKPVDREKLFSVLCRSSELIARNTKAIIIEVTNGRLKVPLSEIRYIEVFGNYVTVHGDEEYKTKATLASFESQLGSSFFRAGRSILINLDKVRKATKKEVFLTTGEILPLSRGVYEKLMCEIIKRN